MLGIVIEKVGPRVYSLIGELDASNVGNVEDVLETELPSSGDLSLDLTELTFVDSMGINLFVTTAQKLEGEGTLILLSPDHSVLRVLELVQLDQRPNVRIVALGQGGSSDG